jgi:hypothetical protein
VLPLHASIDHADSELTLFMPACCLQPKAVPSNWDNKDGPAGIPGADGRALISFTPSIDVKVSMIMTLAWRASSQAKDLARTDSSRLGSLPTD